MSLANLPAPDRADIAIARARDILVRGRDLKSLKVGAGQKIGDTSHCIRTIDGRGPFLEHFDPIHGNGGDGIYIDKAAADQARRHIGLAAAVDQHQRPRSPQTAQIDVGNALGKGGGLVGIVPTAALANHPVTGAQVFEEINRLRRPLLSHLVPAGHGDGVGQTDGRFLNRGTGHHHFLQLDRTGHQFQLDAHNLTSDDHDGFGCTLVADQFGSDPVLASGDLGHGKAAVLAPFRAPVQLRDIDLGEIQHRPFLSIDDRAHNGTR